MITREQLAKIYPFATSKNIDVFLTPINNTLARFKIDTPLRIAAFLAQIGHESGQLRYVKELASGAAYDVGELAKRLGNTPEMDGDGQRYKGRGLIQITGLANYAQIERELGIPCIKNPELLELPENAALVSGWYWNGRMLNMLADRQEFLKITRKINGGVNGLADREALYKRALEVLL